MMAAARTLSVSYFVSVLLAAAANADGPRGRWLITTEAGYEYDNNVGRAERERDIADDNTLRVSLSLGRRWKLANGNSITLRGFAEAEEFRNVDGLSHVVTGGLVAFRWQLRRGFFAPMFQMSATLRDDQYSVVQRDNVSYTSQLSVSKRITENLMLTAGIDHREQRSRGKVFDLERQRLFVNANFSSASGWDPYGTYSFMDGEVWSTGQQRFCNGLQAADIFELVRRSTAIEPDEAFNTAYCGSWITYRLDAKINMLIIGVNKKLQRNLALDLSAAHVNVNAVANEYDVTSFVGRLLLRF